MAETVSYRHSPITQDCDIRLLNIEPALQGAELRISLHQVCLNHEGLPAYSALSYCWEGQIPDCPVLCDGAILNVTKNCEEALTRLRSRNQTITIWIDGICINQTDVAEKSSQIALMTEIYTYAEKVIVWLGEWDAEMRKAIAVVRDIGDLSLEGGGIRENASLNRRRNLDRARRLTAGKLSLIQQISRYGTRAGNR